MVACDGFQAFVNLYEALREEEGPMLCEEEEAAYEAAFRSLNLGPGKLASAAGVLRKSVHSAVLALANRVEKAAWDGRQNHHPACASDDVSQIVQLWNQKVKPGLLENSPRFSPEQIYEWMKQEYEKALALAPTLSPSSLAASYVLLPDEVDDCSELLSAVRRFETAAQLRGHANTKEFDEAYRKLQAAIVDVADLAEAWQIRTPSLNELAGNPFPDFFHERIQDAFIEGAALRQEAMRRRRRARFAPSPSATPSPAAAPPPAPERPMLLASPAAEPADESRTTDEPLAVKPPAAGDHGKASANGNGAAPALDAARGERAAGPSEADGNGQPAATSTERTGKSDNPLLKLFTFRTLYQLTGIADPRTLARYIELAGLPPTKRGGRHRRFTEDQVKAILQAVIDNSDEQLLIDKCQQSLQTIN